MFFIYNDGKITHRYDRTISKLNIEEPISPSSIPERDKEQIMVICPEDKKDKISTWLYSEN